MREKDRKPPRREPPVKTGRDERSREGKDPRAAEKGRAAAPDGISGDWS